MNYLVVRFVLILDNLQICPPIFPRLLLAN